MLWANRENAAAHGFAGGPWPSPTNHGKRPAKRDGHNHPGGRRAGCPHPAGPCRAANPPFLNSPRCGGRERPPYGTGETWWPTGQPRPRVITNLCRGRCLHRPADIAAARTPTGGINPAPTNRDKARDQPGKREPGNVANLCRGRCSHRPADLAPPRTPAGGINPAPTNRGKARDQPGTCEPGDVTNLCRGRFYIGPVCAGAGFRGRNLRPKSRRCAAVGL